MADDWLVVSPSGSISSVKSLNLYGSDLSINECEILKEGSLTKKAEYKKTWRSRYFILFKNGLLLGFEKKPDSSNLKNSNNRFNVTRCETIKCEKSTEFLIRMFDEKNKLINRRFRATNDQNRDEWIQSFESVKQNLERRSIDSSDLSNFVDIESLREAPLSSTTKDDFKYIKQLGKGTFGSVWLVKYRMEYYAMKIIPKKVLKNSKEKEHVRQERRIIEKVNFPFLISLEYAFQSVDKLFMVMEYAAGGELYFHLSQERTFSEEKTRFYVAEIVVAIEHLHSNDIIYRDLKLENILLDAEGHIKLVDFGLSKRLMSDEKTQTFCGTPGYIAPEVIDNEYYFFGYGKEIDWWSLGVVFFEMICGRSPFGTDDQNPQKLFNRILYSKVDMRPAPRRTSNQTKDLIMALLEKEPEERIGSEQMGGVESLKNHPFFLETDWNKVIKRQARPPFIPRLDSDEDVSYFDQEFPSDSHLNSSKVQSSSSYKFSHVRSFSYDVSKFKNSECG